MPTGIYKRTEETKRKLKFSNKGKNKGLVRSKETKLKISLAKKGSIAWNKGLKFPEKCGEGHPRWIKDRTKLKKITNKRRSSATNYWVKQVKKRDKHICQMKNFQCQGILEAHHILNFRDYPELRYQLNNGITLCHFHHPRGREKEKRLSSYFMNIVSVLKA